MGTPTTSSERFERGARRRFEVDGSAGEDVVGPLGDLGRYLVATA